MLGAAMTLMAREQPNLVNVPFYALHVHNPTKTCLLVGRTHLRTNGELSDVIIATSF
jgi:hypothetical protein